MHGFLVDSARALERREHYARLFAFMAERGLDTVLWHFTDDQGCSLVFDTVPEAASPHAWTKPQLRQLVDDAASLGLDVIPELASYGHTRYLTTLPRFAALREGDDQFSGMCPVHPDTRPLLSQLIDETAELFPSPWFHVGMDEVVVGSHPLTAATLAEKSSARLFAEHAAFLRDRLATHGKRMIMWGDHVIAEPSILDDLPTDIVIAPWTYVPDFDAERIHPILERGFDVLLCGALSCSGQSVLPGDRYCLTNLRRMSRSEHADHPGPGRIIGQVTTVWTPTRYMHDTLWLGMDLAAGLLTDGPEIDERQRIADFAESFYGMNLSDESRQRWVDAVEAAMKLAPIRNEWLALLQAKPVSETDEGSPEQRAAQWLGFHDTVAGAADDVTCNQTAYQTFALTLDLIASLYERRVDIDEGRVDQAVATTERLIDAVEAVWDRERHADDPRKNTAAWPRDQTESLIMQLHAGRDALTSDARS